MTALGTALIVIGGCIVGATLGAAFAGWLHRRGSAS
jgi:hypothetical protein